MPPEVARRAGRMALGSGVRINIEDCIDPLAAGAEDESYKLTVTPGGADLHAQPCMGAMRGMATCHQPIDNGSVPDVVIMDRPRFEWSGLTIGVSRHFMPIAVLRRKFRHPDLAQ